MTDMVRVTIPTLYMVPGDDGGHFYDPGDHGPGADDTDRGVCQLTFRL